VREFLSGQFAYTLHRSARRRFKQNPIYVSGIDRQWQADLADMQTLADENDRARYILTVIDVFSKYASAVPIVRKEAQTVTEAFAEVLRRAKPRYPGRLHTDKGTKFFNASFGRLMKRHGITHFASQSDLKAACVECFIRTIKSRLYTYMTAKATNRWVDVFTEIMQSYNNCRHRSIGMAPSDVTEADEDKLWLRLYGDGDTIRKRIDRLPNETMVRVNRWKRSFEKGYLKNWSQEHFTVAGQTADSKRPVYKLKDDTK
jgi:transposase InsO family protein